MDECVYEMRIEHGHRRFALATCVFPSAASLAQRKEGARATPLHRRAGAHRISTLLSELLCYPTTGCYTQRNYMCDWRPIWFPFGCLVGWIWFEAPCSLYAKLHSARFTLLLLLASPLRAPWPSISTPPSIAHSPFAIVGQDP